MKEWIKRCLDQIDELFPPERLAKSKARIAGIWSGERPLDRYPFTYGYATFRLYDDHHTPEERLRASFDEFIIHGKLNDDLIPSVFPGCRQSTIPNMFGAKEVIVGDDISSTRIIHSPEDVDALPEFSIKPGSVAHNWLLMQEYILEETEGRMPVHVTDMQGPVDVCGQMMSYEDLFVLAYTQPETYHVLMNKATDAFIIFWEAQKKLLGDLFVGTHLFGNNWVPSDFGASVSADSLVMVGPDFYNEFFRPYFEKIGDRFGAISVHSCGNFSANVNALCRTRHVRGVNAAQMTVQELLNAGFLKETVMLAFCSVDSIETLYPLIWGKGLFADMTVLMPWPCGSDGKVPHHSSWKQEDWERLKRTEGRVLSHVYSGAR